MARIMILLATVASLVLFGYFIHSENSEKHAEVDSDSDEVG
ncbi:hypothetical protein [Ekhidna sp.]